MNIKTETPSLREKSCTKLSNCAVPSFSRDFTGNPRSTIIPSLIISESTSSGCACDTKREKAIDLAGQFISRLPALREVLATDVEAAYNGDPAAESYGEIISCYPIIKALSNYRIAH